MASMGVCATLTEMDVAEGQRLAKFFGHLTRIADGATARFPRQYIGDRPLNKCGQYGKYGQVWANWVGMGRHGQAWAGDKQV